MIQPARTNQLQIAAVVFLAALSRVVAYGATNYQVDDALITFRYAANLAAGNGFVYNIGERVLGTTSPLFTLILAAFAWMGIPPPVASIIFSILCASCTAVMLVRFAQSIGLSRFVLLPALIYSVYPRCIISDICGLETALFTLLLVLSLFQLHQRRYSAASIISSLACLTRPEGAALLLIVLFVCALERAPQLWRVFIAPVILVGGWLIFSLQYFGSAIPNSIAAKSALYENSTPFFSRLGQMTTLGAWPGLLLVIILIVLTIWLIRRRDRFAPTAVATVGFIVGLALVSPRIFFWYAAPALPLLFLLLTSGFAAAIGERLSSKSALALAFALVLVLGVVSITHVARLKDEMSWYQDNHIAAAEYLNLHAENSDTVLAEDIGHFGYHYRGNIIDRDGLVTPQAIDYNRRRAYLQIVDSVNAQWVFIAAAAPGSMAILDSPDFLQRYELIPFNPAPRLQTHQLYRRL